jgi:hypothetical protein
MSQFWLDILAAAPSRSPDRAPFHLIQCHNQVIDRDMPAPHLCPQCWKSMKLVGTIPAFEDIAEMIVFYCERCKQAETKVGERRILAPATSSHKR